MSVREPAVAGSFYPAQPGPCREQVAECLPDSLPEGISTAKLFGGVVPHAGWVFSGSVAGQVFAALARPAREFTFCLFGAAHRPLDAPTALYARGSWRSPLGDTEIDEPLAEQLLGACPDLVIDAQAHRAEHSLEVQLPFIQHLCPQAKIVPLLVWPTTQAAEIGRAVGRTVASARREVVFVGSSDLTHYGPRYGFTPAGLGREGITWAKEVNDRRIVDLLLSMQADRIVEEAARHHNACGAGALAATVAACQQCGAQKGILISHRTSADPELGGGGFLGGPPEDAVGYAAVVFA